MKILTNFDLNKNELQNAVAHKLATAPASPVAGQLYFDTVNEKLYCYNGTSWVAADSSDSKNVQIDELSTASANYPVLTQASTTAGTVTSTVGKNSNVWINPSTGMLKSLRLAIGEKLEIRDSDNNTAFLCGTAEKTLVLGGTNISYDSKSIPFIGTGSTDAAAGDHTHTALDIGLGNVTNDAQVKKLATSTDGNVPIWNGTTGDALSDGYGVETTLEGSSTKLARADAVKTYVDGVLAANDAMVYKGTLGTGGTITVLPTTYSAGWTYKVITAGTYAGHSCEIGDLLIAIVDRAGTGNLDSDWTAVQTNVDGVVIGPASSTDGNFPLFDGVTGKLLKNSSYNASSFATASHNHDGTYTKKYTTTLGGATSQVVTHNLGTRDVTVTIRQTASPYAQVMADIEFTSDNTLTVYFASAPSADEYTITVNG